MLLRPYSRDTVSRWNQQGQTSADRVIFVLYERASHRPIGETGFTALDWFHRTAEFGILIGETDCWGKGYGTEATRTMLQYGFRVLNLHLIWLYVSSANPQAIRAYQRAGFREAGRLREAQFIAGQRCDLISMDCLAHEFLDGALADAPCS
jgi:RimJ/RimL family protein N-acetyltransferase